MLKQPYLKAFLSFRWPLRHSRSPDPLFSPPLSSFVVHLSFSFVFSSLRQGELCINSDPEIRISDLGFVLFGACSRVSNGVCDAGWVFSATVLSVFQPGFGSWLALTSSFVASFLFLFTLGSGGVALRLLSPHLIKMWGLAVAVVSSPSFRVLGFGLAMELFGLVGNGYALAWLRLSSVLGGVSLEEVFWAGLTALYELLVQRVYTVTDENIFSNFAYWLHFGHNLSTRSSGVCSEGRTKHRKNL
ncbi:Uncharacterized protein Rs2_38906 [Raphanus sativus]|nr:Uncharacterized protein Rs2_38906 [Raphanus sativus]